MSTVDRIAGRAGPAASLWERLLAERGRLTFVALAFALNKVLVLAASAYANSSQWSTRGPRGFLEWIVVDNFRFFDAQSFQRIALDGYSLKRTAFFPLYPMTLKAAQALLDVRFLTAGVLVSHAAFLLLLYAFLRLALLDLNERRARAALLLLALFPTSYYFSAAYSEALFFLLSVVSLYGMRTRRWWLAGLFGGLAALTRNTGVLLVLPFAVEYFFHIRSQPREEGRGKPAWLSGVAWGGLIPLGAFSYLAYLWARFGDPLAFAHVQPLYGRSSLAPWETLARGAWYGLGRVAAIRPPFDWLNLYHPIQLYFVLMVLVVLVLSFGKLRWSYWLIILYSFVIPLTAPAAPGRNTDYFISFSRYSLVMVPLYLGLERLLRPRPLRLAYLALSVALLLLMTWAWSHKRWVA